MVAGEHQRLAGARQESQDPPHVGRKPHVHHSVCLVEHDDLDLIEAHALPLVQVEQSARGGDEQVDPGLAEQPLLRTDRDAAEHDPRADAGELCACTRMGLDLRGEFARGDQDERPQALTLDREAHEDRQHEGGRLAGAGLRRAHEIAARQDERDGATLDGCGLAETEGPHTLDDGFRQAELREGHSIIGNVRATPLAWPGPRCRRDHVRPRRDVKGAYDESDLRSIQIVPPGRAAPKQVTAKKNRQVSLAESERVWQSSVYPRRAQYRRPGRIKQTLSDHPLNRKVRHGFNSAHGAHRERGCQGGGVSRYFAYGSNSALSLVA
jgi:hypothetical protein